MNITNKQKLYFNVIVLFVFAYLLTSKVLNGFKNNTFDFIGIIFNSVILVLAILQIMKYNKDENQQE